MQIISIIMPVYNELETLEQIIEKIEKLDIRPLKKELIVIDDGSNDGSAELIQEIYDIKKYSSLKKIFLNPVNFGKGVSLRIGFKLAEGDIIITQDADLELEPEDINKIIKPILEGKTNVVYGSRFLDTTFIKGNVYWLNKMLVKFLKILIYMLYRREITDEATGYKAIKREILLDIPLKCFRFEFCPEITAKLLNRKEKIIEVPVSYYPRKVSEGKKVRWIDGIEAVYTLIKNRITEK